ncbi:IS3 family transposase, partial [Dietzia lutea]
AAVQESVHRPGAGRVEHGDLAALPRRRPWRDIDDLEIAVAEYIDWFIYLRIHGEIGYVPPTEYEAQHAVVEPSPELVDAR